MTRATPGRPPYAGPVAVDVGALVQTLFSRSGLLWIDSGSRTYAVWFAWVPDAPGGAAAYVVNGPGEQDLPWLPAEVVLVVRDPATGGQVLRLRARRTVVAADDPEWDAATAALAARRLNAVDDLATRWREGCTVTALRPFGAPLPAPATVTLTP